MVRLTPKSSPGRIIFPHGLSAAQALAGVANLAKNKNQNKVTTRQGVGMSVPTRTAERSRLSRRSVGRVRRASRVPDSCGRAPGRTVAVTHCLSSPWTFTSPRMACSALGPALAPSLGIPRPGALERLRTYCIFVLDHIARLPASLQCGPAPPTLNRRRRRSLPPADPPRFAVHHVTVLVRLLDLLPCFSQPLEPVSWLSA